VIDTLSDDSQILLLYLADELPEAERQTVDQRLISEPALAEQLEQLRATYGEIAARLHEADALSTPRVNIESAAQSIGRLMRKRIARSRLRPWLVPTGIAAAILVASAIWITHSGKLESHKELVVVTGPTTTSRPAQQASEENIELFKDSFTPPSRDIADALNAGSSKDLSLQDDVSGFLLKVGTVQE